MARGISMQFNKNHVSSESKTQISHPQNTLCPAQSTYFIPNLQTCHLTPLQQDDASPAAPAMKPPRAHTSILEAHTAAHCCELTFPTHQERQKPPMHWSTASWPIYNATHYDFLPGQLCYQIRSKPVGLNPTHWANSGSTTPSADGCSCRS